MNQIRRMIKQPVPFQVVDFLCYNHRRVITTFHQILLEIDTYSLVRDCIPILAQMYYKLNSFILED